MTDDLKTTTEPFPFSEAVMALYRKVQTATTKETRLNATMELAAQFAMEHDSSDHELSDDYHGYFEQFEKARVEFRQQSVKLGRLTVDLIEKYVESHAATTNDAPVQSKSPKVTN
jgi:hypothetical protein